MWQAALPRLAVMGSLRSAGCMWCLAAAVAECRPRQVAAQGTHCLLSAAVCCLPLSAARSAVFDLPFFFCRGADRMRVLSNLLGFAFDKVEATPKVVNLQLINKQVWGRQDHPACMNGAHVPVWLRSAATEAPAFLPAKQLYTGGG